MLSMEHPATNYTYSPFQKFCALADRDSASIFSYTATALDRIKVQLDNRTKFMREPSVTAHRTQQSWAVVFR